MGYFGSYFGSSGSGSAPAFPNIANATTADAIRDRAVEVVRALVPDYVPGSRFVPYRNEGDGDFVTWCEVNANGAFRRFQIRYDGVNVQPAVSNSDHEEREVVITTAIAYPHDARAGAKQALDRDTAIDRDRDQLDWAIGMYSRPQFLLPNPDAVCVESEAQRASGESCDFLVITSRFRFRRALRRSL